MTRRVARPTSYDVAARAGVSQAAASLVMSGKGGGRVSPALQDRVMEAAAALNYRPHAAARQLREGTARAVGLFVPTVDNPFFGGVLRGAQEVAQAERYMVMLLAPGAGHHWQMQATELLADRAVDGLLLFGTEPPSLREIRRAGHVVLVENEHPHIPSVVIDNIGGTEAAINHLTQRGHTRIGHLAANVDTHPFRTRAAALHAALDRLGILASDRHQVVADLDLHSAQSASHKLLETPGHPLTAVFCDDDILAAGLLRAASDRRLRIPTDLAAVSFTGTVLSRSPIHPSRRWSRPPKNSAPPPCGRC